MRARDMYEVEILAFTNRPWWKRWLAAVFGTLGEFPGAGLPQVVIREVASQAVVVVLDGSDGDAAEISTDVQHLDAEEFAHRWIPPAS